MDESRFDRLEQKIDKLTDAVTKIVRVEEQLISNDKRVERLEVRTDQIEKDLNGIGQLARKNDTVAKFADRAFWVVVTAGVGFLFYSFR